MQFERINWRNGWSSAYPQVLNFISQVDLYLEIISLDFYYKK